MEMFSELVSRLSSADRSDVEAILREYRVDKLLDAREAGGLGFGVFCDDRLREICDRGGVPAVVFAFVDLVVSELRASWLPACEVLINCRDGTHFWYGGVVLDFAWARWNCGSRSGYTICSLGVRADVVGVMVCGPSGCDSACYKDPKDLLDMSDPGAHLAVVDTILRYTATCHDAFPKIPFSTRPL